MSDQKYHFIGIGGIGMSALARILLDKKIPVSGSDLSMSEMTEILKAQGATIQKGHSSTHISPNDTVIFNSQIQKNNPEFLTALSLKCKMLHRSELLAQLMGGYRTLAVTGTHGKTTTSSLLAAVLMEGELDPTFVVGGMLAGSNGKLGRGQFFVAEADESDGSFLNYHPEGAIITNIEADHLDYYKTENLLQEAFSTFFSQIKNLDLLFYCGDDPQLVALANGRGIPYGFERHNALRIENYEQNGWESVFDIHFEGKVFSNLVIPLIAPHNALNAAAVLGLSLHLGVAEEKIRDAFKNFPGVERRCEKKGEAGGVLFLDDYGHHPTEIRNTVAAIKNAIQARRLIVVFQPHRYTRLRDLFYEFCTGFEMADLLYVTDVYAAQETPIENINAQRLIEEIHKVSSVPCSYLARENWCTELKSILRPHDVLLTLGAGDITYLYSEIAEDFPSKHLKVGLIFGGKSCEHEISLRSARFVAASLNANYYNLQYFGIDKKGQWVIGKEAEEILQNHSELCSQNALSLLDPRVTEELNKCDLFLPILHGTYGEDGTIQGFFEMLDKPYMGPDYRAAAICMDKILTKRLVESKGIKTPRDITFGYLSWRCNKKELLQHIFEQIPLPVYVKPVHLGSSVGITRVDDPGAIDKAIDFAFRYDTQVMVEEGKEGCRELEFAVLGNTHSFTFKVPAPGEKLGEGEFINYEKKYGQNAVQTTIYPDMPPEILEKGKKLAKMAYEAVGCSGMTRVDFLLDPKGEFWLFEMNPIPGLQKLSLFPKIWNREGFSGAELIDHLIVLALERHQRQKRHYKCLP